jgi:hypothetical protein
MSFVRNTLSGLRESFRRAAGARGGSGREAQPRRTRPGVETLESRLVPAASPSPVLMVLANRDFYYADYSEPRAALEAAGLEVEVAAASASACVPHWGSGQGSASGTVMPDLTLAQVDAAE